MSKFYIVGDNINVRHEVKLDLPDSWLMYEMRYKNSNNDQNDTSKLDEYEIDVITRLIDKSRYLRAAYWLYEGGDV